MTLGEHMAKQSCLAIILAAGEGQRMRSDRPKVMHQIGGMPMLGHVLDATRAGGIEGRAVVVGPGHDGVRSYIGETARDASVHLQEERLGTGHAVLTARRAISSNIDQVIVLYGDTPLVSASTLRRIRRRLAGGADMVVVGFRPDDPGRYGRLVVEGKRLLAIREAADASPEEMKIGLCNAGIIGFSGDGLLGLLKKIGNNNAKGEFYLTDAVELATAMGKRVVAVEVAADEVLGINTRAELAQAEAVFQGRARRKAMAAGVTMIAPETVWFSHDTRIGRDVTIEPNVYFGPGVRIGNSASILANSHIVGATIGSGASIGPFARVRPGTKVGSNVKVGNFVEVKNATIGAGAKVGHLAYVGDTSVGARANIGAGTITCNYDGFAKYRTNIGEDVFIGSNSSLIAPVTIGAGAYVASGSVITGDVADDAMAISRQRQVDKPGWAKRFRQVMTRSAGTSPKKKAG
jgi:bifunctional UDP-N-acetylglucosamine pyrophosphorylase/glucosamine-1-phosphate N-acetyltransferase